ncbi:MAG TPA: Ger(x)C family spore germination protein [Clostridiaceae bacterium]|nr:Ger(x)C family spore germination protein [Clostridiaceae bacterium]
MRKSCIAIVFLLLVANITGCRKSILPQRKEIGDLQLIQVIGVDKLSEDTDNFMLTVASRNLEEGSGQQTSGGTGEKAGGDAQKAIVLTSRGKTIFEAVRKLQTHSNKTLFWGHAEYYLIGEEAARDNIAKYIDFFTRDHELRIESKVYIVRGSTAKDLIEKYNQGDFYIFNKLEILGQNLKLMSNSEEMRVHDLMRLVDIHHESARAPCIRLTDRDNLEGKKVKDIEICGYAIFANLKLVGFIDIDVSRGLNLITNNVGSSIVVVKDLNGQNVSLEIIDSNTEVIPFFSGDSLESVTLKTKVISNIGEIHSQIDIVDEKLISHLESQLSEILKNEMEEVLKKVLDFKSDCLEICDRIRLKRPLKWHKIEEQWMEILPDIKFNIQVESKIQRSYETREHSGSIGRE